MSCKHTKHLLAEMNARELTAVEKDELTRHISSCSLCFEESKHETILTSILKESTDDDNSYIIPQELMRVRVEQKLQNNNKPNAVVGIFTRRLLVPLVSAACLVLFFFLFQKNNISDLYEYTVALDGIDVEIVTGDKDLCDMLFTIGLPDASIDVIGCDTTCKLVIFDLKSEAEAEKVIHVLNSINKDNFKTKINKIKQYNIS